MLDTSIAPETDLRDRVLAELQWDSQLDEAHIAVVIEDGVVKLTGTASSYAEKLAAQDAAHRVNGVRDVANEILVVVPQTHQRSDSEIARAVRDALEWNVVIPADGVSSTVTDGWVTLEGTVGSWRERIDAESVVRFLTGVKGVVNKISVASRPIDPELLRQRVESALERRAQRGAKRIQVETVDGTVTVSGTVSTWLDKQAVIGTVSHAPGVQGVVDQLVIDPYA